MFIIVFIEMIFVFPQPPSSPPPTAEVTESPSQVNLLDLDIRVANTHAEINFLRELLHTGIPLGIHLVWCYVPLSPCNSELICSSSFGVAKSKSKRETLAIDCGGNHHLRIFGCAEQVTMKHFAITKHVNIVFIVR